MLLMRKKREALSSDDPNLATVPAGPQNGAKTAMEIALRALEVALGVVQAAVGVANAVNNSCTIM